MYLHLPCARVNPDTSTEVVTSVVDCLGFTHGIVISDTSSSGRILRSPKGDADGLHLSVPLQCACYSRLTRLYIAVDFAAVRTECSVSSPCSLSCTARAASWLGVWSQPRRRARSSRRCASTASLRRSSRRTFLVSAKRWRMSSNPATVHFDVMDNRYVPNLTIGPMVARRQGLRHQGTDRRALMVSPVAK